MNLSHPYGTSVNDKVDKLHFDGRHFTLKFPSIDDVVEDILATDDPVIFKVDPGDTFKFGISWQDQLYVNLSVAFGWTHRSASFQMASDTIAFIMKGMGCKVRPYIDDYVSVAPRHKAQDQFNSLVSLLQELGFPMNVELQKNSTIRSHYMFRHTNRHTKLNGEH